MRDNISKRDFEAEKAEHQRRQEKASKKIADHRERMDCDTTAANRSILNEMNSNKTTLDINRAMQDYDEEHKDEK